MSDAEKDQAARAASDAVDAWRAANPAPTWPVLPDGVHPQDFTEVWSGTLARWPDGRVEVTYTPAAYRVWPQAYHYSRQLGTAYHWYWQCFTCGHVTEDLIPTREQAVSEAETHAAVHARDGGDGQWLTAEELRAAPILCETCGTEPADFHGADGWMCGSCDGEIHPRYEG